MADSSRLEKHPLLVFGLAGRIGAGVSFVRDKLEQQLRTYGYESVIIRVTNIFLIELFDTQNGQPRNGDAVRNFNARHIGTERIAELQRRGNQLRAEYGNDIISKLCISHVIEPWLSKREDKRIAFIVDSIKRPEEADLLRSVFRDSFTMIAVVASDEKRKERLKERKAIDERRFLELSEKDADEGIPNGQQTSEAVLKADYFLSNNYATKEGLDKEAARLFQIMFNVSIVSPRPDEFGMHIAFEAAARSACLSRQVGAALFSASGDILSTGCNDVPKFGGGLYTSDDNDKRCWTLGAKCYNDSEKEAIIDQLIAALSEVPEIKSSSTLQQHLRTTLSRSRIKSLIEFSRAVHAEMDAMLAVARSAEKGLAGSTLYSTTYPCHNCAKHIIAAGVTRVVYLEPYEKSLARSLHSDAISDRAETGKVFFDTYGGVAPRRYNDFFAMKEPRKQGGKYLDRDRTRSLLIYRGAQPKDELHERVRRVAEEISVRFEGKHHEDPAQKQEN